MKKSIETNKKCKDKNCPFHGSLKTRGRTFTGTVISTKMHKAVKIEFGRRYFLSKYERYEKRRTKITAHQPDCISLEDGDIVKIQECRPLSKTKNFVVIEKLGQERGFTERMESFEESRIDKVKKSDEKEKAKEDLTETEVNKDAGP